ncbi:FAD-binding oxidoreductase [Pseudooceanicola sp. CBS1P-1]|uniref:FAD-dependent oxidoreductase n=1 Tax=Pseudooceanicola albus TaxID=2692189 RepID=A0A6L7G5T5_9RHOB|nr:MULTISPECIES: FAD-binding oxidoreductase [Pseudooceanicola]MBT9385385.1 FAD-binding oxidoreductase [Pseudooceanicola endophyticus]MXN18756.1 FAD-dependent oxidoreductase [Pseudooceanicola albus]
MSPKVDQVVTQDVLPDSADVVIVGAGIVGITTALFLAERGLRVTVLEKGRVAGEQSGRNWGWVREQLRSPVEQGLAILSLKLWRGMSERIGADAGFRKTGMMVVSKDPAERARWEAWQRQMAPYDLPGGILEAEEVRAAIPETAEPWTHAIHSPEDGWAEPRIAVPAMARAAMARGAVIVQNCAVRGWESEAGRIARVVTERGTIRTARVVVAGGAWSAMLLRHQGIRFLQSGVYGTAFRTEAAPEVYAGGVGSPLFSYRRRDDGGYTVGLRGRGRIELSPMGLRDAWAFRNLFFLRRDQLTFAVGKSALNGPFALRSWKNSGPSPFEEDHARVYDPPADPKLVEGGMAAFRAAYPVLEGTGVAESWGGVIDATPDMVPVIGPVPRHDGLFVASGFSGHGFAIGPGAGWLIAQMVAGEETDIPVQDFRFQRFAEQKQHPVHHWI